MLDAQVNKLEDGFFPLNTTSAKMKPQNQCYKDIQIRKARCMGLADGFIPMEAALGEDAK